MDKEKMIRFYDQMEAPLLAVARIAQEAGITKGLYLAALGAAWDEAKKRSGEVDVPRP
jgi:hypothetical protein